MIFTIWIWFNRSRSILSESGKRRLLWYCGDIFKGMMRLDGDGVCWQWIFPSQCLLPSLFHPASQCPSLLSHPHISHNVQASNPILISPPPSGRKSSIQAGSVWCLPMNILYIHTQTPHNIRGFRDSNRWKHIFNLLGQRLAYDALRSHNSF